MLPAIGEVFTVPYPFVRDELKDRQLNEASTPTWKPGIRYASQQRYCGHGEIDEHVYGVADGIGSMRVTVVGVYRPGRFPTRVFYSRQWVSPEGKEFGKVNVLRIATLGWFNRMVRGYQHEFVVEQTPQAVSA